MATTPDDPADPFHAGERELQSLAGVREQSDGLGRRMIRRAMPDQHREFFARLPFVIVGSVGDGAQPHASVLAGPPGFMRSPDPRSLTIAALPSAHDPLAAALRSGAGVGLLGIEPHTRRRNRLNGVVSEVADDRFTVTVVQSFGNCPKYIQARKASWIGGDLAPVPAAQRGDRLDLAAATMIAAADTFFIASAYPAEAEDSIASHGVDVSHRGGKPGFVRVERDATGRDVLTVPDFSGNGMFNTLGNLAVNPRAGLLFLDYERGDVLQLTTDTEVLLDDPDLDAFAGAERLLRLTVRSVLRTPAALPLQWSEAELSPFLLETGEW